jgi:Fe-Mn family superoxide dismutase
MAVLTRRVFLANSLKLSTGLFAASAFSAKSFACEKHQHNPFTLAKLPYAKDALSPYVSKETMTLHYDKHHAGYVAKLNELVKNSPYAGLRLPEVIKKSESHDEVIFNNAAQIYNHDFYWRSMKPQGGGKASGEIQRLIVKEFGNYDKFCGEFLQKATAHFGSGWLWLVQNADKKLALITTSNAQIPPITQKPLLTIDLWEHAYYVDYRNERAEYAKLFLEKLVNWEFANSNLKA